MAEKSSQEAWLRDIDLAARYQISRKSVWVWVKAGILPPPVRLGPSTTRWRKSTVDAADAAREAG